MTRRRPPPPTSTSTPDVPGPGIAKQQHQQPISHDDESEDDASGVVPASISYLEPLLHPLRDLTENWNVDLCRSLQAYLADIDDDHVDHPPGRAVNHSSFNFARAALVIQGSSLIYGKKVEYFYSLVRRFLDRHTRMYAAESADRTGETDRTDGADDDTHARRAYDACDDDERELSAARTITAAGTSSMLEDGEAGHNITGLDDTFAVCDSAGVGRNRTSQQSAILDTLLFNSAAIGPLENWPGDGDEEFRALDMFDDSLPDTGIPPVDPLFLISEDLDGVDLNRDQDDDADMPTPRATKRNRARKKRALFKELRARTSKLSDSSGNFIGEKFDFFINRTILTGLGWFLFDPNLTALLPKSGAHDFLNEESTLPLSLNSLHQDPEHGREVSPLDSSTLSDAFKDSVLVAQKSKEAAGALFEAAAADLSNHNLSDDEGIELPDHDNFETGQRDPPSPPHSRMADPSEDLIPLPDFVKSSQGNGAVRDKTSLDLESWSELMDPYDVVINEPANPKPSAPADYSVRSALIENTAQFDYRAVTRKAASRQAYLRSRYQYPDPPTWLTSFDPLTTGFETVNRLLAFVSDPVIDPSHHTAEYGHTVGGQVRRLRHSEFTRFFHDITSHTYTNHSTTSAHGKRPPLTDAAPADAKKRLDRPDNDDVAPFGTDYDDDGDYRLEPPSPPPPPPGPPKLGGVVDYGDDIFSRHAAAHADNPNMTFFALDDDDETVALANDGFDHGNNPNTAANARQAMRTRCRDYLERAQATARSAEAETAVAYEAWERFIKDEVLANAPQDFQGHASHSGGRGAAATGQAARKRQQLHDRLRYDIISDQETVFRALGDGDDTSSECSFADVVKFAVAGLKDDDTDPATSPKSWLGLPKLIPRLFFACLLLANSENVDISYAGGVDHFALTLKSTVRHYDKLREQLDLQ